MKKRLENPLVVFTDFDGTLYDLGFRFFLSPFYNSQSARHLRRMRAGIVIVTGRSSWSFLDDLQLQLLRFPRPDVVIYGGGTHILRRGKNGILTKDQQWDAAMSQTEIRWTERMAKTHSWQKNLIEETLQPTLDDWLLHFKPTANSYMSVVPIANFQIRQLKILLDQLQMLWKSGIKLVLTEKLYLPNSLEAFNGYLLVIPEPAGKDNAATYVLKEYANKPKALFFGDALVDVPMLAAEYAKVASSSFSYGVHMTPMALENMKIADPESKILRMKGSAPKALRDIIRAHAKDPISAQEHAKLVEPA